MADGTRIDGGTGARTPRRPDAVHRAARGVRGRHPGEVPGSIGARYRLRSAGSRSSEMSRMLESATGSGIPAQWVRKMRWLTPSSS